MTSPLRSIVGVNRGSGTGQRSCPGSGRCGMIQSIEAMIADEDPEAPIVRRECPGRWEQVSAMRIAPAGLLSSEIDEPKLPLIIAPQNAFIEIQDGSCS